MDLAGAAVGGALLAPVMAGVAVAVGVKLKRPIIFVQERPGRDGEPFTIYKFRNMTDVRDAQGNVLPDSDRLEPFALTLRRWSLDELPQLWNVLTGEMSLVGPRPLLMEYLPLYSAEQARRHDMRPGITGLAQVLGRNGITWDKRFELDVWYVDHWSIWLDLKILAMSVSKVFSGANVSAPGHATIAKFEGEGHSATGSRGSRGSIPGVRPIVRY
jgi:sugar transferase EpsL